MSLLWRDWLPQHVADAAISKEPGKFSSLSKAIDAEWRQLTAASTLNNGQMLKWVPTLNMFLNSKVKFGTEDVQRTVHVALEIVMESADDVVTQVRWANCLSKMLRSYRHDLKLEVPWRKLYMLLSKMHFDPTLSYQGAAVMESRKEGLIQLVRKAKRFFPKGSAAEIWDEFHAGLLSIHQQVAYESLGWLNLLMPTHAAERLDGDWNNWVTTWFQMWASVAHNSYWDCLWMSLIARLVKHDKHGIVKWELHLDALFTHVLWGFQVPVGTSSSSIPISRQAPQECETLFGRECTPTSASCAKAIVFLMGRCAEQQTVPVSLATEHASTSVFHNSMEPNANEIVEDGVAVRFELLVDLLEQYFHPSNGGRWTNSLSSLLRNLMENFMKRIVMDASMPGDRADEASDDKACPKGAGTPRLPLSTFQQNRFLHALLRLAGRAQYSKDSLMMESACGVLSRAAYVAPAMVLPVIQSRFNKAFEAITATHLLVTGIHTLALCVRPLLIAGIGSPTLLQPHVADSVEDIPKNERLDAARTLVADAMMATLPGIDANDPPKTLACFRLYCGIFSSVGSISGLGQEAQDLAVCPLPLYTEEWVDEFLSRIFAILSNLDSPEGSGATQDAAGAAAGRDQNGSFLLLGTSMFRPMIELLFARLPHNLKHGAIRRLARFVLTTTLPSVTTEASVLCNAAAWADPKTAGAELLDPLLEAAISELPEQFVRGQHLSNTAEGTLLWQLGLIAANLYHMGDSVLSRASRLQVIVDRSLAITTSIPVQEAAMRILSALVGSCVTYFPIDQYSAAGSMLQDTCVEEWMSKSTPQHIPRPVWHIPNSHQIELATQLVHQYLDMSCSKMQQLCKADTGSDARTMEERDILRQCLLCIEGILSGARTSLPDFVSDYQQLNTGRDAVFLALEGEAGAPLDLQGTRESVAAALLAAFDWVNEHDTDSLKAVIRLMSMTISMGTHEYEDASQSMGAWQTDEQSLYQSAIASSLRVPDGLGRGTIPKPVLKRHRPRWLAIERVYLHGLWRASQAVYRPWITTSRCEPDMEMVPKAYRQTFHVLLSSSVHPYKAVRDTTTHVLERCLKRYPCLVPLAMPVMLQCLAWQDSTTDVMSLAKDSDSEALLAKVVKDMKESTGSGVLLSGDSSDLGEMENRRAEQQMEAAAMGACNVLRGRACWRLVGRDSVSLTALLRAICLSARHTSIKSQNSINDLFLIMTLRFIRPPEMRAGGKAMENQLPAVSELVDDLLAMASTGTDDLHWRYSIIVNAFLLFLLPVSDPITSAHLSRHFMQLLVCDLLPLRQLALSAISFQVSALPSMAPDSAWAKELRDVISKALASPGYPRELLENLAHNHTLLHTDAESGGRSRHYGGAMNREEAVVKSISATLSRFREWPVGKKRPVAIKAGQFILHHARGICAMSSVNATEWCGVFEDVVKEALKDQSDLGEKSTVCAAAEILAGLLASGAAFKADGNGVTAWESWIKDSIASAIAASPLELADMWGLTVRYAVSGLCDHGSDAALDLLLRSVSEAPAEGVASSVLVKHLKCVSHSLSELCNMGCRHMSASIKFHLEVIGQIESLSAISVASVRRETARCMVALVASAEQHFDVGKESAAQTGGMEKLLGAISDMCNNVVHNIDAGVSHVLANSTALEEAGSGVSASEARPGQAAFDVEMIPDGQSTGSNQEEENSSQESMENSQPALGREVAISCLGTSLQFIVRCLRSGDPLNVAGTLVGCLPSLFRIQEMPDPDLQPLAMEAKTAFALLKYLPVKRDLIPHVVDILCKTRASDPWHARAAALVFMQYFWFRQVYQLSQDDSTAILGNAVAMMSDRKLEVQEIASNSLSGIIRAQPACEAARLRTEFVNDVREMMASRRGRRRRVGSGSSTHDQGSIKPVSLQHAPVLGLKAFVLSTPYDVPRWLPDVLMALVGVASEPQPIKTTVTRSLGEFRRTHEEAGLQECRDFFDSDQWEAIQGVSSTVSYFV